MTPPKLDPAKTTHWLTIGLSQAASRARWVDKSTNATYYNEIAILEGVTLANTYCSDDMVLGETYDSEKACDFGYVPTVPTINSQFPSTPDDMGIEFYLIVKAQQKMAALGGYTGNHWVHRHGLGGTSAIAKKNLTDWNQELELRHESTLRIKEAIKYEKEVNGKDSQIVISCFFGNNSALFLDAFRIQIQDLVDYYFETFGVYVWIFMGGTNLINAALVEANDIVNELAGNNPNVIAFQNNNPGGLNAFDWAEANDPDGIIIASDPLTWSTVGESGHFNWSMMVLQGVLLWQKAEDALF